MKSQNRPPAWVINGARARYHKDGGTVNTRLLMSCFLAIVSRASWNSASSSRGSLSSISSSASSEAPGPTMIG